MRLPRLNRPELYQGLYVFDFGDHVSVGYTVEEIQTLLRSAIHGHGQAYRIHHASPDGQLALRQLSQLDTDTREAVLFSRRSARAAEADFEALQSAALRQAPPVPLHWHLLGGDSGSPDHGTLLLYAAAHSAVVGLWLCRIAFEGGDRVEAGTAVAEDYHGDERTPLRSLAIAPDPRYHARPAAEVLETVDRPVQRELA